MSSEPIELIKSQISLDIRNLNEEMKEELKKYPELNDVEYVRLAKQCFNYWINLNEVLSKEIDSLKKANKKLKPGRNKLQDMEYEEDVEDILNPKF